jgi:hypothetical protein
MAEFERFQQQFCIDNPVVSRFSTAVVVDPVKVGLAIEISEDGR